MPSIIKEFYLGNLTPNETQMRTSSEMAAAVAELAKADAYLRTKLDEDCLAALERLVSAQTDLAAVTATENYTNGFRCGAKFMLDILFGEGENTQPLV